MKRTTLLVILAACLWLAISLFMCLSNSCN
jgi:hypothetical protein